jgi:hypothetical protein
VWNIVLTLEYQGVGSGDPRCSILFAGEGVKVLCYGELLKTALGRPRPDESSDLFTRVSGLKLVSNGQD